jgi:hypothetical protein
MGLGLQEPVEPAPEQELDPLRRFALLSQKDRDLKGPKLAVRVPGKPLSGGEQAP